MTGKKEAGTRWRNVTVAVREDIFSRANSAGIDIRDTCNRALASLVGIDYSQQNIADRPLPLPVIVAPERPVLPAEGMERKAIRGGRRPVINADDPSAVAKVLSPEPRSRTEPVPDVPSPPVPEAGEGPVSLPRSSQSGPLKKGRGGGMKKRESGGALKRFVTSKISRVDDEAAVLSRDELYEAFSRWCREEKIGPVPDRKAVAVALKNRFAIREKISGGLPCWVNIRLR